MIPIAECPERSARCAYRALGALFLVALLCLASADPHTAAAHGIVLDSTPKQGETVAAPKQLVIRFNSRLEKRLCSVTVVGANQRRLLSGQPSDAPLDTLVYPLPELAPGAYQARWKVLAADGHVTEGMIAFTVASAASR